MSEPAYLPSEISEHHQDGLLPGFGPEEATLEESLAPDSLVQPVLSLSIISTNEDGQLEVWDGIRYGRQWPEYADGTQPPQAWSEAETHPDTVSTATICRGILAVSHPLNSSSLPSPSPACTIFRAAARCPPYPSDCWMLSMICMIYGRLLRFGRPLACPWP